MRKWGTVQIDRALLELRRRLQEEHGAEIYFNQEEFESQWKNQTMNWLLSWNPSRWTWDNSRPTAPRRSAGCSSSKPREDDRAF